MRRLIEAVDLVYDTLEKKDAIYGQTYRKVGAALGVEPQYSILVRMLEKCIRLNNLLCYGGGRDSKDVAEEFLDIAVYAVLGLFESSQEGGKEEEGKEEEEKEELPFSFQVEGIPIKENKGG